MAIGEKRQRSVICRKANIEIVQLTANVGTSSTNKREPSGRGIALSVTDGIVTSHEIRASVKQGDAVNALLVVRLDAQALRRCGRRGGYGRFERRRASDRGYSG